MPTAKSLCNIAIAAILVALPASSMSAPPASNIYTIEITRVVDGDTVAFKAAYLPKPLKPELLLRVYGIDTPEKGSRAKCNIEQTLSLDATRFTTHAVESAKVTQMKLIEWDKYGGRVLGDLILDGKSLRNMLIDMKLAVPYFGEAKQSWCK